MFNWNNKQLSSSATVRVIGDRAAGKTTFMAALARYPNAHPNSQVQAITAINEDGEKLIKMAQEILEQGLELEPTDLNADISEIKDYLLQIVLKSRSSEAPKLSLNCKDYAGEFFSDLLNQSTNSLLQDYLDDCLQASGIMLLVDGTSRKYTEIAASIDKFLVALDRSEASATQRRIAMVITKCEQPELWINRKDPKQMASNIFPQIYQKLQAWRGGKVEYFAASAFGMIGTNSPAPNFTKVKAGREGLAAVLKYPNRWRPFGLVAPIYWLCTGQRRRDIEGE